MMLRVTAVAATLVSAVYAAVFEKTIEYSPFSLGVMTYTSRFSYFDAEECDSCDRGYFDSILRWQVVEDNKTQGVTGILMDKEMRGAICEKAQLCGETPPTGLATQDALCQAIWEQIEDKEKGIAYEFLVPESAATPLSQLFRTSIGQRQTNFWYVYVANCDFRTRKGIYSNPLGNLEIITRHYQKPNLNHWLYKQFSSELSGMNLVFLLFWLTFTTIIVANSIIQFSSSTSGVWGILGGHHVTRLFSVILVLQWSEYFFGFCHYATYADNGIGDMDLLGFSKFLGTASQCFLILLVLLLAKGYTITSSRLRSPRVTLIVTGVMSFLYIILFIIQTTTFTIYNSKPDLQIISWQTWAGVLILILRFFLGFYFLWEVRSTYMMEDGESQLRFYFFFATGYFLWLISLPVIVSIAAMCDYVYREKIVEVLFDLVNLTAICMMGFLLRPRSNEFFKLTGDKEQDGESVLPYDSI